MAENMGTDDVVVAWQRGDEPGIVEFVVTTTHVGEFQALLAEQHVTATSDPQPVRGAGTDIVTIVAAVAGNPAAWAAIGLAVRKFFDRHRGKRIRVDENGLAEAQNYSAKDIERIVRALSSTEQDNTDADERR